MKVNILIGSVMAMLFASLGFAQQSQIVPWWPARTDVLARQRVYHPEPVLFVHGINDNDLCWQALAIPSLASLFCCYELPISAVSFIGPQEKFNAIQVAYLHTFNYGNYVKSLLPDNAQSFDHIEWNAWEEDMRKRSFTNAYLRTTSTNITVMTWQPDASIWGGHPVQTTITLLPDRDARQAAPTDNRMTLESRINGRAQSFLGIRDAYRVNPDDPDSKPNIVLVAHSMGGLLSHYYLCKCQETGKDSGVRRLVTLATPHCGSPIANDQYNSLVINPVDRLAHGAKMTMCYKVPRKVDSDWDSVGFTRYPAGGALEDLAVSIALPSALALTNDLQTYFASHAAPSIEYVFNGFLMPTFTHYRAVKLTADTAAWCDVKNGDGVVSLKSASGKRSHKSPSIWVGQDPVIFGPWPGDHCDANKHPRSLIASLFGVPYQWPNDGESPPLYDLVWPLRFASTYDERQSFGKYLPLTDGQSTHSDEPGIGEITLLCVRPQGNPLVIPALNTWGVTNENPTGFNLPRKLYTATKDLSAHQIAGDPQAMLRVLALTGAKNRARTPFGMDGTNFWTLDGNEYLPASLQVRFAISSTPIGLINDSFRSDCISSNLTLLDSNESPQYQYGLFDRTFYYSGYHPQATNPMYFAIEGTNLAGFFTPRAERGFDVPVDSATVVNLLCGINEREAVAGSAQTPWTAYLTEWIDVPSNSAKVALNFFPQNNPDYWDTDVELTDAFTHGAYTNWTYSVPDKTFTLTDAPSCLQVSYTAYLGCKDGFTTNYEDDTGPSAPFEVPPLTNANMLAGIPATPNLVQQMKTACRSLCPLFVDHTRGSQGDFNKWFAAHTDAGDFPMQDATSLAGVEDDYFEGTPDMVSQLDFDQVHTVLTNLQWTAVNLGAATVQCALGMGYGADLTNAFQAAEADYQDYSLDAEANTYAECMGARSGGESAMLYNRRIMGMVTNVYAGTTFAVMTYAFPAPYETFDDNGQLPVAQLVPQCIESQSGPGGQDGYWQAAQWFGARALPGSQIPHWAEGWDTTRGYYAPLRAILLWQFQYR